MAPVHKGNFVHMAKARMISSETFVAQNDPRSQGNKYETVLAVHHAVVEQTLLPKANSGAAKDGCYCSNWPRLDSTAHSLGYKGAASVCTVSTVPNTYCNKLGAAVRRWPHEYYI